MVYDFHTHTFLSDGVLSPIELIRRAVVNQYTTLGISDHAGAGTMERVIAEVALDCRLARERWQFLALPGIELTHVPASAISDLARQAKEAGAAFVIVHGESPVEPVEPGTNLAAVSCPKVDILAHPGLLTTEEAELAAEHGVLIELTAKDGHSLGNGRVVQICLAAGARMVVNSDAHVPNHLLTEEFARRVARCAGLPEGKLAEVLIENPQALVARTGAQLEAAEA
jgi:putative hydrolase